MKSAQEEIELESSVCKGTAAWDSFSGNSGDQALVRSVQRGKAELVTVRVAAECKAKQSGL